MWEEGENTAILNMNKMVTEGLLEMTLGQSPEGSEEQVMCVSWGKVFLEEETA